MEESCSCAKRKPQETDAWVIGNSTAALTSALCLVHYAKVPPSQVHILDPNESLAHALHQKGNPLVGYGKLAACLPVPVDSTLGQLLAPFPSLRSSGRSALDDINSASACRYTAPHDSRAGFVRQAEHEFQTISTNSLGLRVKNRLQLLSILLRSDVRLGASQIEDFLDKEFFESSFWTVWSAQYGLQFTIYIPFELTRRLQILLPILAQRS